MTLAHTLGLGIMLAGAIAATAAVAPASAAPSPESQPFGGAPPPSVVELVAAFQNSASQPRIGAELQERISVTIRSVRDPKARPVTLSGNFTLLGSFEGASINQRALLKHSYSGRDRTSTVNTYVYNGVAYQIKPSNVFEPVWRAQPSIASYTTLVGSLFSGARGQPAAGGSVWYVLLSRPALQALIATNASIGTPSATLTACLRYLSLALDSVPITARVSLYGSGATALVQAVDFHIRTGPLPERVLWAAVEPYYGAKGWEAFQRAGLSLSLAVDAQENFRYGAITVPPARPHLIAGSVGSTPQLTTPSALALVQQAGVNPVIGITQAYTNALGSAGQVAANVVWLLEHPDANGSGELTGKAVAVLQTWQLFWFESLMNGMRLNGWNVF